MVVAIVVVVFVYLLVRPFLGGRAKDDAAQAHKGAASAAPLVNATITPQMRHAYLVSFRAHTQAARTVEVRSETAGPVASTPILQGSFVRAGTVLCRLNVDARQAALDQARAILRSKQVVMQASTNLAARGFRAKTQVMGDQAEMDSASAAVRQAEVAMRQVNIVAPFAGVFDRREAEVGAYLAPGQACGVVIELDPLLLVGDVSESDVGRIAVGALADATLASGGALRGHVRFVAKDADPATRTYRVEITLPNPGSHVASGLSADVHLSAGVGPAHLVPASALVLDAAGRQGVRYVAAGDMVAFLPVKVLEETPAGVWISGLAGTTRVITVGQSFVAEGQHVRVFLTPASATPP